MAEAVHDISLLIEHIYESNYDYRFYGQFDSEKKLETEYKLNDIIAARMLVIFFANYAHIPNFRNIIKSAIASVAVLDIVEDVIFQKDYSLNNTEELVPQNILNEFYSKIKKDEDIYKEYMVSNDVVTDIIFDVMDNDFFNKGYHDQIMSILSYLKSKNMLIYQCL